MLYLFSAINLFKNILEKIWSYKIVRFLVWSYLAYYLISGFGSRAMSRVSNLNFTFNGWDSIISIPSLGFNANYIKSNKATGGVINAISKLFSVFVPGLTISAIILYLQDSLNKFKAPPLPIIFNNDEADEIIVADYRMPTLYTKGESEYYDDEEYDESDESDESEYGQGEDSIQFA